MDELPTTLSPAAATAVVALVDRSRVHAVGAVGGAVVSAAAARLLGASVLVAAVVFCVAFPVAARLIRALRLAALRRRFTRDPEGARRAANDAWQRASPGQRAALRMLIEGPH